MAPDTTPQAHRVLVQGCDHDTEVVLALTPAEFDGIRHLVAATATAAGCEPKVVLP